MYKIVSLDPLKIESPILLSLKGCEWQEGSGSPLKLERTLGRRLEGRKVIHPLL